MGFRIVSPKRLDFDRLWAMMYRLRRFLEFLSQQHFPHTHLMVFDEADIERGVPDIEVRYSSLHAVKPKKFEWPAQAKCNWRKPAASSRFNASRRSSNARLRAFLGVRPIWRVFAKTPVATSVAHVTVQWSPRRRHLV